MVLVIQKVTPCWFSDVSARKPLAKDTRTMRSDIEQPPGKKECFVKKLLLIHQLEILNILAHDSKEIAMVWNIPHRIKDCTLDAH